MGRKPLEHPAAPHSAEPAANTPGVAAIQPTVRRNRANGHHPRGNYMATTHKSQSHDTPHALDTEDRKHLNESTYAFPRQRKEPLNDASHVRNAIARFDQVKDVSDADREAAFHHIETAARKFGVEMIETNWRELGSKPRTTNSTHKKAS
jgi:hypothetical protein